MNFCPNCGAAATGTPFCGNCGQPMTAPSDSPLAQPSGTADKATGSAARTTGTGGTAPGASGTAVATGATGAAPGSAFGAARVNPFADIPVSDYIRDAIALVLLLVSFGMPWDLSDTATGKVYVLLVTLLSVVSLSLPYLKRGGVLPATWGTAQLRLARLAANVPYVVVVLITFILAYAGDGAGDGIGVGIAFGLAGAILAAQGRQAEQEPGGDAALWRLVCTGLGLLFAVLTVISIIIFLTDFADGLEWEEIAYVVVVMLFFLALAAMPRIGAIRGEDAAWRDVLILLGVVALFVGVWQLSADGTLADAWSLRLAGPQLVLVPALAAAVSAAALCASARQTAGAAHWVTASIRAFQLVMVVAAFSVVLYALQIIAREEGRGVGIVVLVLYLVVLLAAVVGRNALTRDANLGRAVALICAAVLIVIGVVVAAVLGASDTQIVNLADATAISVLWWFAVAVIVVLTVPTSVRDELGPVSAPRATFAGSTVAGPTGAGPTGAGSTVAGSTVAGPTGAGPTGGSAAASAGASAAAAASPGGEVQAPDSSGDPVPASPAVPADAGKSAQDDQPATGDSDASATTILAGAAVGSEVEPELLSGSEPPAGAHRIPGSETRPDESETRVDQTAVGHEPPGEGTSPFNAQLAADPSTPLQTLADIAAQEPSLRPYVASNPSAYPELLVWLGQLGDPEIDKALRRRGR